MKNFLRLAAELLLVALLGRVDVSAQVVTTQPEVITQDTKNVVITFHADWATAAWSASHRRPPSTPIPA